jgi:hypothetical protein
VEIAVTRTWSGLDTTKFWASTTGVLLLDGQQTAFTLEPTALMIPTGVYPIKMAWSPRFNRNTPHLDVPGRTEIEIHGGNVATDSDGCILVAEKRIDEWQIYDSAPAREAIEHALSIAEANGETNTITIS